jgi:DNA-binding IclR family transcriptional regulator
MIGRRRAYYRSREVTPAQLHVLKALGRVYLRDGRATVASVAKEAGKGTQTTWTHLSALQNHGLVEWEGAGSLRPGTVRA